MVTKEMLMKLSRKDRKEYLERRIRLNDKFPKTSFGITYVWWTVFWFMFTMIVLPLWKLAFSIEVFSSIAIAMFTVIRVMYIVIVVGFLIDLVSLILYFKRITDLRREYFVTETKPKRKRNVKKE